MENFYLISNQLFYSKDAMLFYIYRMLFKLIDQC